MSTTFSNALAGLSANAQAINVVSGNLANLNTTGYKNQAVSFENLVSDSLNDVGSASSVGGNTVARTSRQFSQGSVTSTSQPYDAAVQGNGFFVLRTATGQQVFTRDGSFGVDSLGHLKTATGDFVQGWAAVNGVLTPSGSTTDITLPIGALRQPTATSNFSLTANLDAAAAVGSPDGTFSTPIKVFDSQGNSHLLSITYTETSPDNWSWDVSIPSSDITGGAAGATTKLASGALVFDGTGHLKTPTAQNGAVAIDIKNLASGASDMTLNWNLYDENGAATLTSFNQTSANLASTQDGTQSGQLSTVSIGEDGIIEAHYTNGDSVAVAQLALASVLNPDSMQQLSNNTFAVTSATSLPAIGASNTGARGQIVGGSLESSTVDIAKEFTNLLTYERGYQANSKVVTTEDDILQETVSLKR